jgi:ubiquinone/menaquinone biosynthesis C-methylase UbiE
MGSRIKLKDKLSGKEREAIPNVAFRIMTVMMYVIDLLAKYSAKNFKTLELKMGQIVIDYGCGPARYIKKASNAVGEKGKVIAVDIHPLAIKNVNAKIKKFKLKNVEAVLAKGYNTSIDGETADVVYALDMFHMISQPKDFLMELCRLAKNDGIIIIEDGHQPREETIRKIDESGVLKIIQETMSHVKCKKLTAN